MNLEGRPRREVGRGPGGTHLGPSLLGANLGYMWGRAGLLGLKRFHGATSSVSRKQEACAQCLAHASVGAFGMAIVESFRSCQVVPRQPNHQAMGRAVWLQPLFWRTVVSWPPFPLMPVNRNEIQKFFSTAAFTKKSWLVGWSLPVSSELVSCAQGVPFQAHTKP